MESTALKGESSLRREIGLFLGIALVINATIGTGIFRTPAKVARLSGSLDAALWVWVAGGALALAGALSLAELSSAMPRAGGIYEYLRRAYGPRIAFLMSWAKISILIPSSTGSFAKLSAEALASIFAWPEDARRDGIVAVVILAVCAAANISGAKASAVQQSVLTAIKYSGVAFLALVGLLAPIGGDTAAPQATAAAAAGALGLFAALVSVMWAYDGWADLSSLAGEVKNPEKTLPRALLFGTLAIAVVYVAANLGYARILGLEGLQSSTTGANMAAANLAEKTLGGTGRTILSILILVSCVGGCMAALMTGSRMLVPAATDGLFPKWIGVVSERARVPQRAILIAASVGAVYVFNQSFEQLTEAFVVGYFPFYALAVIAVFILRRKEPGLTRPFRIPLYPIPPLLFLIGAAAVVIGAIGEAEPSTWIAFGVVLAGLPAQWIWLRFRAPEHKPPL